MFGLGRRMEDRHSLLTSVRVIRNRCLHLIVTVTVSTHLVSFEFEIVDMGY